MKAGDIVLTFLPQANHVSPLTSVSVGLLPLRPQRMNYESTSNQGEHEKTKQHQSQGRKTARGVSEGLEICFMLGDTGAGRVLKDFKLADAMIQLIGDRAGLDTKSKGAMTWEIHGVPVKIAVEEYVSFGECCFRLSFSKRKGKAR